MNQPMFRAARQYEELIDENHRRKLVVRFCSRYSGFDLQLRQRRSLPGQGPVQRLPARVALHAWPRPEMAGQASSLVRVRSLKLYRPPGGPNYRPSSAEQSYWATRISALTPSPGDGSL